jgi:hypothetical protein
VETPEAVGASQGDRRGGPRRLGSTGISDAEARSRETGCGAQLIAGRKQQTSSYRKRRVRASQGFRSFWGAYRTIEGYEAVHAIRKGQAKWVGVGQIVRQLQFIAGLICIVNLMH